MFDSCRLVIFELLSCTDKEVRFEIAIVYLSYLEQIYQAYLRNLMNVTNLTFNWCCRMLMLAMVHSISRGDRT